MLPDKMYNVKFADNFEVLQKLYLSDICFKDIFDRYCKSIATSENCQKKYKKHFRHHLEFENLSKELEEEILFYLMRNI